MRKIRVSVFVWKEDRVFFGVWFEIFVGGLSLDVK